jgi:hypothetical protein
MMAPADVPATLTQLVMPASSAASSAPTSAMPFTPPPSKTPSALSVSSGAAGASAVAIAGSNPTMRHRSSARELSRSAAEPAATRHTDSRVGHRHSPLRTLLPCAKVSSGSLVLKPLGAAARIRP